jgi:hypothetical protein
MRKFATDPKEYLSELLDFLARRKNPLFSIWKPVVSHPEFPDGTTSQLKAYSGAYGQFGNPG